MKHHNAPTEVTWYDGGGWAVDDDGDIKPLDDYPDYLPDEETDTDAIKTFEIDESKVAAVDDEAKDGADGGDVEKSGRPTKIATVKRQVGKVATNVINEAGFDVWGSAYGNSRNLPKRPLDLSSASIQMAYRLSLMSALNEKQKAYDDLVGSSYYQSELAKYQAEFDRLSDNARQYMDYPRILTDADNLYSEINGLKRKIADVEGLIEQTKNKK